MSEKRGRGRPSQGKVMRPYTIDKEVADYVDSLPDGDRSRFVNNVLLQAIREKQSGKTEHITKAPPA